MEQRREVTSLVVLIVSLVVLTSKLFSSKSIQIVIDQGQAIPIDGGGYFTFSDVLVVIVSAWVAGMSAFYLMRHERFDGVHQDGVIPEFIPMVLKILEGDEKKMYKHIADCGGEILQKDLVMEIGFDKAKVTRILSKLENKDLIMKIKHGMTNRIVLQDRY